MDYKEKKKMQEIRESLCKDYLDDSYDISFEFLLGQINMFNTVYPYYKITTNDLKQIIQEQIDKKAKGKI